MRVAYYINGEPVEPAEFSALPSKLDEILESGHAPGGHAPYWGTGHESISSAIPSAQAQDHADWIKQQGLVGVEVVRSQEYAGATTVVTTSPENRRKYLAARGLVDANQNCGMPKLGRKKLSTKKRGSKS